MKKQLRSIIVLLLLLFSSNTAFSSPTEGTINLMTYNIASLPSALGIQINGEFLRPNVERAQEIANVITLWNQGRNSFASQGLAAPNIIGFEEAFDSNTRELLKQKLSPYYPYNSGNLGEKVFNAGSGLLLFSQYPILSLEFHPYQNEMVGEESLAYKGFITAKLKYNNQYFFTVIMTHLEAGGAIDKDNQSKEGTTSVRRGEQMGRIYVQVQTNASTPPTGYENLKYLKTFVMGDFNVTLDNEHQQKSISSGTSSSNGYKAGQIKYPGQYWLFSILKNIIPDNFLEVRVSTADSHQGKQIDPVLLQQAIQENKFTGSTLPSSELKKNKNTSLVLTRQTTENRIIDGIFDTLEGINGNLHTQLISLNETSTYKYGMSDHYTLIGKFTIS